MTPGEVIRAIESNNRLIKRQHQEQATYDYIQATLIVKGVSICLGDKTPFPSIREVYPGVFDELEQEEKTKKEEEAKTQLSTLRFLQFAQSYNKNYKNKEVLKQKDE